MFLLDLKGEGMGSYSCEVRVWEAWYVLCNVSVVMSPPQCCNVTTTNTTHLPLPTPQPLPPQGTMLVPDNV